MVWIKARENALEPIGLHEGRHTYASLQIAARVDAKAISTYMGHSSVAFTLDRYAKLFKKAGAENAALLDAFLERSDPARVEQLEATG